jgi:hypothetical protein
VSCRRNTSSNAVSTFLPPRKPLSLLAGKVNMTVQLVRDIAAVAFRDAIDVLQVIETLEAGNAPSAVAAVNAAGTDAVAECVYRALWSRLILLVTRAYAPARPGDLHAQYAFDLLKDTLYELKSKNPATPQRWPTPSGIGPNVATTID